MNISSFFQASSQVQWVIYCIVALVAFLWIYCLLWVAKDSSTRTEHFSFQLLSILLILLGTPLIWLPLYFLIRPIRQQAGELTPREQAYLAEGIFCAHCEGRNSKEFEFCVYCGSKLKHPCKECKKPYPLDYEYCPFCGAPNLDMPQEA